MRVVAPTPVVVRELWTQAKQHTRNRLLVRKSLSCAPRLAGAHAQPRRAAPALLPSAGRRTRTARHQRQSATRPAVGGGMRACGVSSGAGVSSRPGVTVRHHRDATGPARLQIERLGECSGPGFVSMALRLGNWSAEALHGSGRVLHCLTFASTTQRLENAATRGCHSALDAESSRPQSPRWLRSHLHRLRLAKPSAGSVAQQARAPRLQGQASRVVLLRLLEATRL